MNHSPDPIRCNDVSGLSLKGCDNLVFEVDKCGKKVYLVKHIKIRIIRITMCVH